MSDVHPTPSRTESHGNGLGITINNKDIEDAPTDDLKIAKEGIAEGFQKLNSEIIHRSDDQSQKTKKGGARKERLHENDKLQILMTVNKEHIKAVSRELEIINTIASPRYTDIFNKSRFGWFPAFVQKAWVKVIAAILPTIIFAIILLTFIYNLGKINSWAVLGIISAGVISLSVGLWLLRIFSEAQRYTTQEKIRQRHHVK
jgi:hypothetical protein